MDGRLRLGTIALGERPTVVAAGGEREVDGLVGATADAVELRADLFADPTPAAVTTALGRLRAAGHPIIFTVRSEREGGKAVDDRHRRALYEASLPLVDAVDLEIASSALVTELVPRARAAGRLVILSSHTFDGTPAPSHLREVIEQAFARGADVAKIATFAQSIDDLRTLLEVTLAARVYGVVTLAMGPAAGPLSRLVLPAAGSLLTYGHVGRETAPGQLAVDELTTLVRRFYP